MSELKKINCNAVETSSKNLLVIKIRRDWWRRTLWHNSFLPVPNCLGADMSRGFHHISSPLRHRSGSVWHTSAPDRHRCRTVLVPNCLCAEVSGIHFNCSEASQGSHWLWKVRELIWSGNFVDGQRKLCVSSELHGCCLFMLRKWNYALSACYNEIVMKEVCAVGQEPTKMTLHKTSSCTWDGSANNVEHSQGP